jgi:RHS repeat-associated protein
VGKITQESINGGPANTFGCEDLYRLTSSSVSGVASSWVYDNNGNRTSQTVGGVATNYTPDDANRLIAVNGVTVTNDANGNVTGDGTKTYSWDVRGRLVGMTGSGLTASFVSDYLGRRFSKTISGTTTTFLNDGDDVVTDTTGGTASQTLHGPAIDEPLARNGLFFTPNHLGSTTTLTDATGAVQQSYQYSPFGETTGSGSVDNPFQFTGRENDGTGLMYYRSRYYMPAWGRFISEDLIGLGGGINQYTYAHNSPAMYADPDGKFPFLVVAGIALFLFLASERPADVPSPDYQHCNVAFDIAKHIETVTQFGYCGVLVPPGPPPGYVRVGRWMSRAEYDAMVAKGRVQPTLEGIDMKSVTVPPDPDAFRAAKPGTVFAEFDVPAAQLRQGGTAKWGIIFGPNSILGRLARSKGVPVEDLPEAINIVLKLAK